MAVLGAQCDLEDSKNRPSQDLPSESAGQGRFGRRSADVLLAGEG